MDIDYLVFLQNLREATGGIFNSLMSYITTFGEILMTVMIAAVIYWCVDKKQGIFTMMTWGAGLMMNGFLKVTFCTYRPWIRDSRVVPVAGTKAASTGYSFPSGHVTNATSVYGSLAANKKISVFLRVLLIVFLVLICFSRNYLGVHTPQDVLVGCGVTLILMFFMKWILEKADKVKNLDIAVTVIGILLNIAVIAYAALKNYPMDYDAEGNLLVDPVTMAIDTYSCSGFSIGVLVSWLADRRLLHYEVKGTALQRVSYGFAGLLGYFVLLYVLLPLLPSGIVGSTLNWFFRPVYVMLAVPSAIKLIQKRKKLKADMLCADRKS